MHSRVARADLLLEEFEILGLGLLGQLLALDGVLEHVHQVHGVGGHLGAVEVEGLRQDLVGEAGGEPLHPLVHARGVAILLHRARRGVGLLQALAVIDPHLGVEIRVLVLAQPRQHRHPREHVERARRAGRLGEVGLREQLLVNLSSSTLN
jgi:hypothetical protein